jgi:tetratricopeptide (TPR) repeat protein
MHQSFDPARGGIFLRAEKPRDRKAKSMQRPALAVTVAMLLGIWSCAATPSHPQSRQWSCDSQADQTVKEGQWEQALKQHQAYLEAHPGSCLTIYHMGYIWGQMGDHAKEASLYDHAVHCGYDGDDQLYFNLGMAYAEMDQTGKAIAAFERAVALKPQNAENHFGLGLAAGSAGQLDLAVQALRKTVALDPRHWDARLELARIQLDQGRLEEARIQLEAVQRGDPDNELLQALWQIYQDRKITVFMPSEK